MFQKFKVLSFVIVASLYIFLVPTTSNAGGNWQVTHTPGESVGYAARAAIAVGEDNADGEATGTCIQALIYEDCSLARRRTKHGVEDRKMACAQEVGLGYVTRYIQYTGGYCYYYKGGHRSLRLLVDQIPGDTTHSSRRDDQVIQRANNGVA